MSQPPEPAPRLLARWEAFSPGTQAAIVFPIAAVLLFLINLGPFHQPWWRSIIYGLIEGLPVTALVVVATVNERNKRRGPPSGKGEADV